MGLGVAVQGRKHDGQDLCCIVADQAHDVLVVPVIQRSLCHLEDGGTRVVTGPTFVQQDPPHCISQSSPQIQHTQNRQPEEPLTKRQMVSCLSGIPALTSPLVQEKCMLDPGLHAEDTGQMRSFHPPSAHPHPWRVQEVPRCQSGQGEGELLPSRSLRSRGDK